MKHGKHIVLEDLIAAITTRITVEIWIKKFGWVKLHESQTLVWPRARKTLNTKTATFWYIRYIPILEKDQELKIAAREDKVLIYNVSKIKPPILYILRDMIPPLPEFIPKQET